MLGNNYYTPLCIIFRYQSMAILKPSIIFAPGNSANILPGIESLAWIMPAPTIMQGRFAIHLSIKISHSDGNPIGVTLPYSINKQCCVYLHIQACSGYLLDILMFFWSLCGRDDNIQIHHEIWITRFFLFFPVFREDSSVPTLCVINIFV